MFILFRELLLLIHEHLQASGLAQTASMLLKEAQLTPLPSLVPHLVTLFLHHFNVPLDDEPYVKVKRSFSIGVGAVTSFGYRKDVDG